MWQEIYLFFLVTSWSWLFIFLKLIKSLQFIYKREYKTPWQTSTSTLNIDPVVFYRSWTLQIQEQSFLFSQHGVLIRCKWPPRTDIKQITNSTPFLLCFFCGLSLKQICYSASTLKQFTLNTEMNNRNTSNIQCIVIMESVCLICSRFEFLLWK